MAVIHVRYFAALKDQLGRAEDRFDGTTLKTPADIVAHVKTADEQGWVLGEPFVRVIVNDTVAGMDHPLSDGDTVAFCPPFSGG